VILAKSRVSVVILTFNEEKNLAQALDSVIHWAHEVVVLDSFSTDDTLKIAARYDCAVFQNAFEDYAKQRNFAIEKLPIASEWILFLDADEWIPRDLANEIVARISGDPVENGFNIKRRFIWMGRWIRRGYYPTWILRLFRRNAGRCEQRSVNEHLVVDGVVGYLDNDFVHEDHNDLGLWIIKHDRYATREAAEMLLFDQLRPSSTETIAARLWGSQAERKRWVRHHVWNHLPPLVRPFLYFLYRYLLLGGFLDGRAGFVYHFMQALWFPLLIDAKYLEMKRKEAIPKAAMRSRA